VACLNIWGLHRKTTLEVVNEHERRAKSKAVPGVLSYVEKVAIVTVFKINTQL
jgi:hypothetical protein